MFGSSGEPSRATGFDSSRQPPPGWLGNAGRCVGRTLICGGLVCGVVMLGRSPPFGAGFCGYCGAQVPRGWADSGGLSGGGGGGGGASGGGELVSGVVDGAVLTGVDVVASVEPPDSPESRLTSSTAATTIATTATPIATNAVVAELLRYQGRSGNQNASAANGSKPSSNATGAIPGSVGGSASSTAAPESFSVRRLGSCRGARIRLVRIGPERVREGDRRGCVLSVLDVLGVTGGIARGSGGVVVRHGYVC